MSEISDISWMQDGDGFEKICAEVILTTHKRMIIQCTGCYETYKDFKDYMNHYYDIHIDAPEDLRENPNLETETLNFFEDAIEEEVFLNDKETFVKLEIEPYEDEALREEELPISFLKELQKMKEEPECQATYRTKTSKDTKTSQKSQKPIEPRIEKTKSEAKRKESTSQQNSTNDEFNITTVVRDVQKRTNWVSTTTPMEERKHKCPICGLAFKDKYNVRHHVIRHTEEKKHECPKCGKKFFTSTEVKIHLRSHTQERNFLCDDCGRAYRTKFQLKNHTKRHQNQRDYKCRVCDKAYFDSHTLKEHMYKHAKDKPVTCEICNTGFSRPVALKNHMKLHENKRAYKCSICKSGFNQKAGLFSHMKTAHKIT